MHKILESTVFDADILQNDRSIFERQCHIQSYIFELYLVFERVIVFERQCYIFETYEL